MPDRGVGSLKRTGAVAAVAAALACLVLPGAAVAQNGFTDFRQAAQDQYGGPGGGGTNPGGGGNPGGGNPGGGNPGGGKPGGKPKGGGREQSRPSSRRRGVGAAGRRDRRESGSGLPLEDSRGGSLPFTGLDLTLLVLIGALLVVAGCLAALAERRLRGRAAATS